MEKGCSFEDVIQFPQQTIVEEMENGNLHLFIFNDSFNATFAFCALLDSVCKNFETQQFKRGFLSRVANLYAAIMRDFVK